MVRASPATPLNQLSGFSSLDNLFPTFGHPLIDYAIEQEAFMKAKLNEEENHARILLKKPNSLAIIGNSGQIAPVLSSAGAGSLVLANPSGVSLLSQFTNAINTLNASASRLLSSAAANLAPLTILSNHAFS